MADRGRRIAFDYGDARIGVAVCDPDGILATPLPYIANKNSRKIAISRLLQEYQPIEIFIGKPVLLSGNSGEAVAKVESFTSELATLSKVKITFIDERLSTVDAARKLREAGVSAKDQRELIDSAAAVAILEAGLARG